MKEIVKIDIRNDEGNVETKLYQFDEKVIDELYLTIDSVKVKKNVRKFGTVKRKPRSENDIGLQYSKNGECVIITFGMKHRGCDIYGQYLVGKTLSKEDVINCDSPDIEGMKPYILDGIDLANVVTMADLEKLERLK